MIDTPVCIVGAGPAGLVASLFLSKHGVKHTIFERKKEIGDKVCGECYDGRLANVLNKLDANLLHTMLAEQVLQPIEQYQYFNHKGKGLNIDAAKQNAVSRYSTYRRDFDTFLRAEVLKSPYAKLCTGEAVNKIVTHTNNIEIITASDSTKSELAIIATGNLSMLANQAKQVSSDHFLLAARGYYRHLNITEPHGFQVYLINKPVNGYLFINKLPKSLYTVEMFILKQNANKYGYNAETLLQQVIQQQPQVNRIMISAVLVEKIKGASLPSTANKHQNFSAERILLAGSSSSGVNPLTGWGVGHAVFQGMCAAEQCVASLQAQQYGIEYLQQYDIRLKKSLQNDWQKSQQVDFIMRYLHKSTGRFIGYAALNKYLNNIAQKAIVGV
jgi:flavin-dependent dehydrogenase